MSKLRVGVITGGMSGEHEVSLVSASSVISALDKDKYEVVPIGITKNGKWISGDKVLELLKEGSDVKQLTEKIILPDPNQKSLVSSEDSKLVTEEKLDVILPILHGTYGEDGKIQGLLELANIAYVGADVAGSALCMDKVLAKYIFQQTGLQTASFVHFSKSDWQGKQAEKIELIEKELGFPVFVKPVCLGSSVGINKAKDQKQLIASIAEALSFDNRVLIEKSVEPAQEIECAVLGNDSPEASIPGEVLPADEFYSYKDKYIDNKTNFNIPADLPKEVLAEIQKLSVKIFKQMNLCGLARVDFLVKDKKEIFINEINTMPGFTKISMYPKLWAASGLPYETLLDRLIELGLEKHQQKNQLLTNYDQGKFINV